MYRQLDKNLLNSSISPTCPHNMANFGPLAAEIGSLVWGTSANSNGFRVLTSLLPRRRSTEANQTLHDVWPSPGLVHYIFRASCPVTKFCKVQMSLCVQQLSYAFSYIGSVTARYSSSGRPSRWASAHILVISCFKTPFRSVTTGNCVSSAVIYLPPATPC